MKKASALSDHIASCKKCWRQKGNCPEAQALEKQAQEETTEQTTKLKIILVPVGAEPHATEINRDLSAMQQAIGGGYVQSVRLSGWQGVELWCDEEGRIKDLPRNRYVHEIHQWVHGPFFLTGTADDEGETLSIPDAHVNLLLARFGRFAETA